MKKTLLVISLLLWLLPSWAGDIHVSPTGSDSGDGTAARPLRTLHQALRQAREWRRLGDSRCAGGIRILMGGGTYRLDRPLLVRPEDSGTEQSPTIIMPWRPGEQVVVSGGVAIGGWQRGTSDERVAPALRSRLWTAPAPLEGSRPALVRQLTLGTTCRATQYGFTSPLAHGSLLRLERMLDFDASARTITIPTPPFLKGRGDGAQAVPQGLEMLVHQRWAIALLRVKSLVVKGDRTVVTFHEPESTLEFEHPWPQPVIDGELGNSSFTLMNALELLDEAGEWVQDWPSGRIFYLPAAGEVPGEEAMSVPLLERLVTVSGTAGRRVEYVQFRNITFADAAWTRPSRLGHVTLQGGFPILDAYKLAVPGLPEKAELENQAWVERPDAAVSVSHARHVDFVGCSFRNLASTALDLRECVDQSLVDSCRFEHIGGTALLIGTFPDEGFETHVPFTPLHEDELCHHITVSRNVVNDCTIEDWGCVGMAAGYVSNVNIVQNVVSNVNYSGICIGWGWTPRRSGMHHNTVSGNHIHRYARQLYDAGGIYTLSNQPNSLITGNRIARPSEAPYATNRRAFCIYFDEATDGFTVSGNDMDRESIGWNKPGKKMKVEP
ncbi:MAG: right-handed parallel beta-helix repeat-containing protein [Prevotella sp.]|nr:right-handed parallel beta-helix repeat-containing protein [Prevotella sp.]